MRRLPIGCPKMDEIELGIIPVDLGLALGLPLTGNTVTLFRMQNRGPQTVYMWRSLTAPIPGDVRGFRHPTGSFFLRSVYSADIGTLWAWTASGDATLVIESPSE